MQRECVRGSVMMPWGDNSCIAADTVWRDNILRHPYLGLGLPAILLSRSVGTFKEFTPRGTRTDVCLLNSFVIN